ncbi:MAG: hypothetical protein KDD22_08135, partial [Bdellovibrionales bacterium]|nr:hypothetical protein [Bdellovibrionales bacterium]
VLPKTQNKLRVLIQSLDDEPQATDSNPNAVKTENFQTVGQEKKKDFFAGLGLRGVQTKEWTFNTDAGIKLVWPPDPFARARLRRSFFMGPVELRLTESINWFESQGWWQVASVELDRPLPPKHLLRWGNSGIRRDEIGYWEFSHYLAWYHQSSPKDALSYSIGISSVEDPAWALQNYYVSIGYRRHIFDKWMFLDLGPTGSWPRSEHFTFTPSFLIKLEVLFGS